MKSKILGLLAVGLLAGPPTSVQAAALIVDGADNSPVDGDCTFACVARYQQAYDSSLFSGTSAVTAIDFRYSPFDGYSWQAGNQYRLTIGIAASGVNALNTNQNLNFQSSQVFDIKSFSGNATPGDWYGFAGNYVYDSSLGDLLIDIQLIAGNWSSIFSSYNDASGAEFSRTWSGGFVSNSETNAFAESNYGNVTRFNLEPAIAAPEPGTLALLGLGLAGLGLSRRRKAN